MLIVNEDNSHLFHKLQPSQANEKYLNDYVDNLANASITHLFINPNAMRTSYKSKVWEAAWEPMDTSIPSAFEKIEGDVNFYRGWQKGCKMFFDAGINPYEVLIKRCVEKGIEPWVSVRMNDVHHSTEWNNTMSSDFWRKNKKFWCNQKPVEVKTKLITDFARKWTDFALDYSHAEVRDHYFKLINELSQWEGIKGIELDFMRFGVCLRIGRGYQDAHFITDFVRDVRKLCNERGLKLAVRVWTTPKGARYAGFDAPLWAKDGLVDIIIPSPFYFSADYELPIDEWKREMGAEAAKRIEVIPATDSQNLTLNRYGNTYFDVPTFDGWASCMYYQGAKSLYLFNFIYVPKTLDAINKRGVSKDIVVNSDRRHPAWFRDFWYCENPDERRAQLTEKPQVHYKLDINCGILPSVEYTVQARISFNRKTPPKCKVLINGVESVSEQKLPNWFAKQTKGKSSMCYNFDIKLKEGANKLEIIQADKEKPANVFWAEIRIKPKK